MSDDLADQRLAKRIAALLPGLRFPQMDQGIFTPTFAGTTIAGSYTYTTNLCLVEWSRIGNRLLFNGRIVISAIGVAPTGTLTIAGFPYAAVSDATMAIAGGATMLFWAANVAAGYTQVEGQMSNGEAFLRIVRSGDNLAPGSVAGGELIVGDWRFAGQYRIA